MPRISRSFITERLLPAVDIEKLIGSYIKVQKKGANYFACCPFHHEKTPSFSITPSKGMFYCFGCHEHGNAISFIEKYKNLSFVDAVEDLAGFAGLKVEYEAGGRPDASDKFKIMYELMDRCASAFTHALFEEQGRAGLDYFMKNRGLSKDTILKLRLGFSPDNRRFLQEKVARNEQEMRLLAQLGVVIEREDYRLSMFRNRVMIPIFDRKGRIISFGGRTMGDDKPKYMNTRETPIFRKRNELFGLYETLRDNNNRPERMVVVEGYMDVISVRQAGFTAAVASLGTATTPEQFKLMFRYTNKVICCYDGDAAGRNAAWHALNTITPVLTDDVEVRFAFLPPEDDPDSLVRSKGLGAFLRFLDEAQSYPEFLVSHIKSEHNLEDPNDRARFLAELSSQIRTIPLKALQEVCTEIFATSCGLSVDRAHEMVADAKSSVQTVPQVRPQSQPIAPDERGLLSTPMRRLISYALQYPFIIAQVYTRFRLEEFLDLCERLEVKGSAQAAELLHSIDEVNSAKIAGAPNAELTSRLNTAVLLARIEDDQLRHYFDMLATADLGPQCSVEGENSLSRRIDYLAKLLPEILAVPLRERAAALSSSGDFISADAMYEQTQLTRGLQQRGLMTPKVR